jgi:predicted homoserine dehydrogenase-like protein
MSLKERLQERQASTGAPVRVGLVGAGQMGTGLISQMERMVGMRVVAAADVLPGRAAAAYREASVPADLVAEVDDDVSRAADLVAAGKRVVTTRADCLVAIPNLDIVVECTGVPEVGARVCEAAIAAGRHVVNMNVETDATVGYLLARRARQAGLVYTLAAGDEPGTIKEIYDFADALGFEIVAVGKGKNNPLDRTANPDTVSARARQQNMSAKMLASFVDGTKTMVEMTSIGNGTGYAPEVTGGYGPTCTVEDLPRIFVPKADGGIFNAPGAVDYAVGDVAPGVFIIITTDQPKIIQDLKYLRLNGYGRYWALYRPYHLANLETPITVAKAVLDREVTLATTRTPVAETIAAAKRDLQPGEKLDALGGFTMYGLIERADAAQAGGLLPLGVAVGATVQKPVKQGQPIRHEDVALDEAQTIVRLRREQDQVLARPLHAEGR